MYVLSFRTGVPVKPTTISLYCVAYWYRKPKNGRIRRNSGDSGRKPRGRTPDAGRGWKEMVAMPWPPPSSGIQISWFINIFHDHRLPSNHARGTMEPNGAPTPANHTATPPGLWFGGVDKTSTHSAARGHAWRGPSLAFRRTPAGPPSSEEMRRVGRVRQRGGWKPGPPPSRSAAGSRLWRLPAQDVVPRRPPPGQT